MHKQDISKIANREQMLRGTMTKMHFSATSQLSKNRFDYQRIILQGKIGSTISQMLTVRLG